MAMVIAVTAGPARAGLLDWLGDLVDPGITSVSADDLRLFQQRAEQGDPEAHLALGTVHEKGLGVPQSWSKAHQHYNLALALSSKGAVGDDIRSAARKRLERVEEKMGTAQIAEAQMQAADWMESFQRRRKAEALAESGKRMLDEGSTRVRAALDGFWSGLSGKK
ncbi:SEL1-like repeat protein [Magnetospirillum sp. 15-1]|uniref:SEL1-like repeat protein n=1 Tax=Magnetospirillum sp. 15-1 TaxID=1979370 RepID=UPI0011427295|nr:SEL1-like repeat protein [Magnetospirillum sp. 15-1]